MFFDHSDSTNKFRFSGANTTATKIVGLIAKVHHRLVAPTPPGSTNNNAKTAAFPAADPRHIDREWALKQRDKARIGLGLVDDDVASGRL